jgi:SdrD B-like domain
MKEIRLFIGCFLCASATFGASLNVWTHTLDSSLFPTDAGDASTVTFIESGLSVSTTEGQDFLVLSSFTTGNNGTDNNRQGRWQLATDYTGSDYTYTTASSSVNGSAIYERWINGKESSGVNEYGSVHMSGIYNFGLDTTHTFKLYHRTNAGADIRTQDGTLVVVGLNVAGTTLRYGSATQDTTITPTGPAPYESVTTSTNWSVVEKSSGSDLGAAIDVSEYGGEVFVAASMNCSATGSDGLTVYGEWQLVLYDSVGSVVERLGTIIQRQVLNKTQEKGAAMLYAVTSDLTNGTYTVKLEQKVDATSAAAGRGMETFNASINAVGLTLQDGSDAGDRFESFSVGDETTSTNATRVYDRAVEEESISLPVDQGLVLAAHFTTSGDTDQTGDVLASLYEENGSVARYDSEETLRTVGGSGSKGAGGVIGYSERTAGLYDAALNFRSDAHTYYLSRATLVGFATEAVGDPMVYGDLAWFDTDGNGVVDIGENTPITNVTVELVDSATNVLAVTITDTNGFYQFSYDAPPGSRIRFDLTTVPTNVTVSSTHITGDTGAYVYTTVLTNAPGTTNVTYTLGITYAVVPVVSLIRGETISSDAAKIAFPDASSLSESNPCKKASALYWSASTNAQGGYTEVEQDYDLISWDAGGFQESSNNQWKLLGTTRTNWFVDNGGLSQSRGQLRFYRASNKGRWKRTNTLGQVQRPVASEEVYTVHNVVLSGGQNFVALHGAPTVNTFQGVFGGLERFPGGPSGLPASGATFVEFYTAGVTALTESQYYLNTSGQWILVGGGEVTSVPQEADFFTRGFSITLPDPLPTNYVQTTALDINQEDEGGNPLQVPAMVWSPIVQVPTNGYSQTIHTGSKVGRVSTVVYNLAALRFPVSAHPDEMRLLESGFVNGVCGRSDEIYTMNTATKSVLSGSTIYCDASGTWRMMKDDSLVPAGYFKPNDVIVIVSRNGGIGNSWTWTYDPDHFYDLPTRWMEPAS